MQAHEDEPPVRGGHVQKTGKAHPAPNGESREHIVGEDDPADHQARHGQKHQQVDHQLQNPDGVIFSPKEAPVPASVQDMVEEEQDKHPCSRPLMGEVSPELVAHQEQQAQGQEHIHRDFHSRLRLHGFTAFPVTQDSPRPSSQAGTSLWASPRVRSVKERPSRIVAPAALSGRLSRLRPKPPLALVLKGTRVLPVQS